MWNRRFHSRRIVIRYHRTSGDGFPEDLSPKPLAFRVDAILREAGARPRLVPTVINPSVEITVSKRLASYVASSALATLRSAAESLSFRGVISLSFSRSFASKWHCENWHFECACWSCDLSDWYCM